MDNLEKIFAENPIIDTHAHYDDRAFDDDRYEVLDFMPQKHVKKIITIGCSITSSKTALEIAEKYPFVFSTAGVHPEDCESVEENYIEEIEKLLGEKKVIALGEIGLDYHYNGFDREKQLRLFEEQLVLAKKLDVPTIIHSRDATHDCMELLTKYKPKGVVHCFSGSAETAEKILKLGMSISFTGVLTFKNSKKAISACEVIPPDRLLLETDSPYMAPSPFRGKRCDSSLTFYTAAKLAEIKGVSVEEVIRICNENAEKLFGI